MSIDRSAQLKALHLFGSCQLGGSGKRNTVINRNRSCRKSVWLDKLVAEEQVDRQARNLNYQLKAARFPIHRDLLRFDWHETPIAQHRIEQLATGQFMEQAHNLILIGGTGTGKTHLATAIGIATIHQGKRVRFYNAVDLVNQLALRGETARQSR